MTRSFSIVHRTSAHSPHAADVVASPAPSPAMDSALIARACAGDMTAFRLLYDRSVGRVYALCLRMTADPVRARELTHEAFVRAWERLSSFHGDAAFDTWMHRLTVNVVLQANRTDQRRSMRVAFEGDHATDGHDMEHCPAPALDVLSQIDLERAIAALPPNARTVFVLHDVEGYRHEEIAASMQLAPGTVRAHLHRARKLLITWLNK
jgi:RNA polymerase sigma-70 factor (ECF subfamily)